MQEGLYIYIYSPVSVELDTKAPPSLYEKNTQYAILTLAFVSLLAD